MTTSSDSATSRATLPEETTPRSGDRLHRARPWTLLAFRCVVAVIFLLHPIESLGLLSGETPPTTMMAISVVEIALISLVVIGLYARAAAFLLSGMMAFAFFVIHLPNGWNWLENGGEPPALYCWVFLLLFVLGPGPLSLDRRRAGPAAVAV
jgi:putative oxidoreductase